MKNKSLNIAALGLGAVTASFVFALGLGLWVQSELSRPVFTPAGLFEIERGQSYRDVVFGLADEGVISNPIFVLWYGEVTGRDTHVKSGLYRISSSLRIKELLGLFEKGSNVRVSLFLPEGITLVQSLEKMKEAGLEVDEGLFYDPPLKLTKKYPFLEGLSDQTSFEGFLFPDTYVFAAEESTDRVLSVLFDNFNKHFEPEWYDIVQAQDHSVYDVVTMASILEKEVRTFEEKRIASGVLWKRLALGMPLQLDSTVNYATGKSLPAVTLSDLEVDSPYNTYKNKGLPPGPISNPGKASLEAAVYPKASEYWFYLSRQDTGETIFSKTFAEHRANKARYLK